MERQKQTLHFLRSLALVFSKRTFILLVALSGLSFSVEALSYNLKPQFNNDWDAFQKSIEIKETEQKRDGIAYVASGLLILVGGGIGFNKAEDSVTKFAFTLSQSLGIGAIGYGAFRYSIGHSDRIFNNVLSNTNSLNYQQKSNLVQSYYVEQAKVKNTAKWIRVLSHGLVAALNIYHGSQQEDKGLQTGLYTIGAVNALAGFFIAF